MLKCGTARSCIQRNCVPRHGICGASSHSTYCSTLQCVNVTCIMLQLQHMFVHQHASCHTVSMVPVWYRMPVVHHSALYMSCSKTPGRKSSWPTSATTLWSLGSRHAVTSFHCHRFCWLGIVSRVVHLLVVPQSMTVSSTELLAGVSVSFFCRSTCSLVVSLL